MTQVQYAPSRASVRSPWLLVVGAFLGGIVGNGPIQQYTFGIFLKPVAADLHAGRGTISVALLVGLGTTAVCTPIAGRLMDRYGVRAVVLPLTVGFAASLVAVGLFARSAASFIALYGIVGIFASGQTPLPYARVVARAFDRKRGLALGIAAAGIGVGTALLPHYADALTTRYDWRGGYVGLAILLLVIVVPVMVLLIDEPERVGAPVAAGDGLSGGEALRSGVFWLLGAAFFLQAVTAAGLSAHVVPMLVDQGWTQARATVALSVVGVALILGRIISGYLLDRVFAPWVALAFVLLPLLGVALLLVTITVPSLLIAAALVGLGIGVEIDLIGFLLSRYLGIRAFAEIYGYLFALFLLGAGVGPVALGASFQAAGSYTPGLVACAVGLVVAAVLFTRLRAYRYGVEPTRSTDGR